MPQRPLWSTAAPPTLSVALSPASANGDNGWYRSLRIATRPATGRLLRLPARPVPPTSPSRAPNQARSVTASDAAGNAARRPPTPAFNFDGAAPRAASLRQPSPAGDRHREPTFVFGPSTGTETSGFNRYEVWVRISGTYPVVASVPHVAGQAEYRATRDPALWPTVLPAGVSTTWSVRTVDNAGNVGGNGQTRIFTINPNAPAPPTLTSGPEGLTNLASPTFSWTGDQPGFTWEVFAADNDAALQSGTGGATQATAGPLADGDYTFRVAQVNPFGDEGAEAARSFTVDATPPAAPVITGRPPFPTSNPSPTFSWTMEPGASARWQVLASGGSVVQGSDTPASSATVSPLANGAYVFRVVQIDAAGNASAATSDPFSITGVAAAPVKAASLTSLLPLQNAKRLRPKPGRTLATRTPVLQWKKGPKGTKLYNLQLFRVVRKRPNLPPVVTKVYSAFPRGTQYRVPKSKTRPGTCYIWRIWPYTGKKFTKKPLGISNFCIAGKAKLAKAAKAARAKKARKAKAAAAARRRGR